MRPAERAYALEFALCEKLGPPGTSWEKKRRLTILLVNAVAKRFRCRLTRRRARPRPARTRLTRQTVAVPRARVGTVPGRASAFGHARTTDAGSDAWACAAGAATHASAASPAAVVLRLASRGVVVALCIAHLPGRLNPPRILGRAHESDLIAG
jgi:hypothetical protein